jgi:hypothetical protein
MNLRLTPLAGISAVVLVVAASFAHAQFKGDFPTPEAADLLNDELYFQRAVQVYLVSSCREHVGDEGRL